jgi:PAS domain-containing serine/threonine kinase
VVTKYILKNKIYKGNLIEDERYGCIPLEISILCKLDHANVIKVLEVFHDQEHVQMVMEKHGCGMDLFEFIDRQRRPIDEALASYIFRQLVGAVAYLHAHGVVHRDIKDENVVINESFHVKLIDFGSAAYVTKGKKFATFCGTMDYCSPDVLLGNKYYGPELDVWTCGIALYTLVFCENPFLSAEETIECILKPPFKVSKELMKLLFAILCPKPELRATIDEIEANVWVNQNVDIGKFKWESVVRNTEFHANNAGDCFRDEEFDLEHPCIALKSVENTPGDEDDEEHDDLEQDKFNDQFQRIGKSNHNQLKNKPAFAGISKNIFSKSF